MEQPGCSAERRPQGGRARPGAGWGPRMERDQQRGPGGSRGGLDLRARVQGVSMYSDGKLKKWVGLGMKSKHFALTVLGLRLCTGGGVGRGGGTEFLQPRDAGEGVGVQLGFGLSRLSKKCHPVAGTRGFREGGGEAVRRVWEFEGDLGIRAGEELRETKGFLSLTDGGHGGVCATLAGVAVWTLEGGCPGCWGVWAQGGNRLGLHGGE